MADLAVLRTARLAVEEGLLDAEDFNAVKAAFLRAQQIKAGIEAGFLREEDYARARDAFLHALDFDVHPGAVPAYAALPPNRTFEFEIKPPPFMPPFAHFNVHPGAVPAYAALPPPGAYAHAHANGAMHGHAPAPGPAPAYALMPPPPPVPMAAHQPRATPGAPPRAAPSSHGGGGGGGYAATPVAVPRPGAFPQPSSAVQSPVVATASRPRASSAGGAPLNLADLPPIGRPGAVAGKKSMAGIAINEQCVIVFNHMKVNSAFKWVVFKVDESGSEVVVDEIGPSHSNYEAFIGVMPEGSCRYGVFDYAYTNADTQQTINKLVFINWAPDNAATRSKMMYASTKDFFKGFLDGIGAEVQATEPYELAESEVRERVHQALTRK